MEKLLILGRGYVGRALQSIDQDEYITQTASRSQGADIQFDFMNEKTWDELPVVDACVWTFPATPLSQVKKFWEHCSEKLGRVSVIGTTGSILVEHEHQVATEASAFDQEQERVQGENYLLSQGASLVHSAGIYGKGRDPRDWVMRGLVGPDDRYVNFIHVVDLCSFLISSLKPEALGHRYIASDGNPKKWSELVSTWVQLYNLVLPAKSKSSKRSSKRIDPTQSIEALGIQLKYQSVNEGLKGI